jgi:hypothetical protein
MLTFLTLKRVAHNVTTALLCGNLKTVSIEPIYSAILNDSAVNRFCSTSIILNFFLSHKMLKQQWDSWGPLPSQSCVAFYSKNNGPHVCLFVYLSIYPSVCPSIYISIYSFIYLLIHSFVHSCSSHLEHGVSVKRFISLQFLNFKQTVGLLGRGISPTQGRYLHRTSQTQNKRTQYRHTCLEWESNRRSQCSRGRIHFMP